MRVMRFTQICGTFCAGLCLVFSVGCMSREGVYEDIYRNRRAAYESWKRAKEGRSNPHLVLEGELDMASAVVIAVGNNKQLRAVLQEKEKAQGKITESYSAALPKVDMQTSYKRLDKVGGYEVGGQEVSLGAKSNYDLSFIITQPIFRGGAISAGIRAAKLFSYLTDEQVAGVVQDVVYQTRLRYCDVLLARELTGVSKGDLKMSEAHLEDVRNKKHAGVVSAYDVLRARVEVSNVEAELIETQNALHLAMTSLLKTMGVSQESKVKLTHKLEYASISPELDDAVKEAFLQRPEILQAELEVRLNRQALTEASSGFLPRMDGTFTQRAARPDPHSITNDNWGQQWNAGLTLTWPLFDGLASMGRIRQAKASLQRSVIDLAEAEEQVLLEVKQALFNLEDAEKFVKSQSDNLERAKEAVRLAKAGYGAGVNTEIEMLDARQALSETQARYYEALYRHETAKLDLERATGSLKNPDKFRGPKQ